MSTTISYSEFGLPSEEVWKSYIILGKIVAVPSILASIFLARDIINKYVKQKNVALTSLILLGISVVNIIGSIGWFMTSWMVPKGDAPYAAGNIASCNAQGFFVSMQFIYFVTAYTELAALYYLIVKRRSWNDDYMKQRKIRLLFLLPPVVISLIFATVPLFYEMYNVAIVFCYLAAYPPGCDEDNSCVRGTKAGPVQTFQFAYTMICNVVIIIFMVMLVHHVKQIESRGDNYAGGATRSRIQTQKAYWQQGFRYIGGFTLSYGCVYIFMFVNMAQVPNSERGIWYWVIFYFHTLLNPLAGFFNSLVYFKPRYDIYREQHSEQSRMECIFQIININTESWHRIFTTNHKDEQVIAKSTPLNRPLIPNNEEA